MTMARLEGPMFYTGAAGFEPSGWEDLSSTTPPPRARTGTLSPELLRDRWASEIAQKTGKEPRSLTMPSGLQVFETEARETENVLVSIVCVAGSQILESTGAFLASYAAAQFKPATLETGAQIQVPLFLETGTRVKVDTRDGSYLGRVND